MSGYDEGKDTWEFKAGGWKEAFRTERRGIRFNQVTLNHVYRLVS